MRLKSKASGWSTSLGVSMALDDADAQLGLVSVLSPVTYKIYDIVSKSLVKYTQYTKLLAASYKLDVLSEFCIVVVGTDHIIIVNMFHQRQYAYFKLYCLEQTINLSSSSSAVTRNDGETFRRYTNF